MQSYGVLYSAVLGLEIPPLKIISNRYIPINNYSHI
jgi:hypothetical protein